MLTDNYNYATIREQRQEKQQESKYRAVIIGLNHRVGTSTEKELDCLPLHYHSYPLVNVYITMENHHFSLENPLKIAIFNSYVTNYQRVGFEFRMNKKG